MTVDYFLVLLGLAGGVALFVYGMHVMASGLHKVAGPKMKKLLEALTKNKIMGVFVGTGVTMLLQSSTATTVMVVGFVNAGMMNLTQSVGVIMGANIGTTLTSWMAASIEWFTGAESWVRYLDPLSIAPIAAVTGAFIVLFTKKPSVKQAGEIVVGAGLLFMGLQMMTDAAYPLRNSQIFVDMFTALGTNPILGILAGTVFTGIIQSSSASIVILQSLALVGIVPMNAAIYIILGQNVGTCLTAMLSSVGTSKNAKAAANIHLLFNVIGTVVVGIIAFILFTFFFREQAAGLITSTEISIFHSAQNIISAVMLYPFSNQLVKIAMLMTKAKDEDDTTQAELVHLDSRLLENPSFAVQGTIKEIVRLGYYTLESLKLSADSILNRDPEKLDTVLQREKVIDSNEYAITNFMVRLCNADVSQGETNLLTNLFHTVNDIERVGDHCENLAELAQYAIEENIEFSEKAVSELNEIFGLTISCFENSIKALESSNNTLANSTAEAEARIDILEKEFRASHIKRLTNNECLPANGVVFLDTLTNLERISDHALNIAQFVIGEKPHRNS